MSAGLWLVTLALWGVDAGWQPLSGGGVEYIIQLEPHSLVSLSEGHAFVSDVPRTLDVRTFRIVVGSDPLPHEMPAAAPAVEKVARDPQAPGGPTVNDASLAPAYFDGQQAPPQADNAAVVADFINIDRVLTVAPPADSAPVPREARYARHDLASIDPAPNASGIVPASAATSGLANFLALDQLPGVWFKGMIAVLFVSIGTNVFLAWQTWSERSRYRSVIRSLRS